MNSAPIIALFHVGLGAESDARRRTAAPSHARGCLECRGCTPTVNAWWFRRVDSRIKLGKTRVADHSVSVGAVPLSWTARVLPSTLVWTWVPRANRPRPTREPTELDTPCRCMSGFLFGTGGYGARKANAGSLGIGPAARELAAGSLTLGPTARK